MMEQEKKAGSCLKNGHEDAVAGGGIFYGEGHDQNRSVKIPRKITQSNQTAELAALLVAVNDAGNRANLQKHEDTDHWNTK